MGAFIVDFVEICSDSTMLNPTQPLYLGGKSLNTKRRAEVGLLHLLKMTSTTNLSPEYNKLGKKIGCLKKAQCRTCNTRLNKNLCIFKRNYNKSIISHIFIKP